MNLKNTALGIELGSTRIKAVLIDENHIPVASGAHEWENQLADGIWTYSMEAVTAGVQDCYAKLKQDVLEKYGITLTEVGAIGISGMMHGYLPFDKDGNQLAAFRTWRNTITGEAAAKQQNGGKNRKKFHAFFHGVCPHFSSISMDTMVTGFSGLSAGSVSTAAIASTTSMPSNT